MDSSAAPRLLLVDDEVKWAERLALRLAQLGLEVRMCHDGLSALAALDRWGADVVLLDERMPGMDGFEVCRRLRGEGYPGAILIYSAFDAESDVVLAHEAGADDHVSKAVSPRVVVAKIRRAHARVRARLAEGSRTGRPSAISSMLRELGFPQTRKLPPLTRIEERLLCLLLSAQGELVPADALVNEGWSRRNLPVRVLYEPISNLRAKLAPIGWRVCAVRGRGYRLERDDVPQGAEAEAEDSDGGD